MALDHDLLDLAEKAGFARTDSREVLLRHPSEQALEAGIGVERARRGLVGVTECL
jgi:hypothetical protein